ncbi:MAG: chorismate mutase [Nevskiales bacterium]|nr:chorismate mutase [Nevskiales bacterium]
MSAFDDASLDELRSGIDRIDGAIVGLLAQRARFVAQAARLKQDEAQIRAPQRVEAVIARARALAENAGLDPDVVEPIYRTMIEAFIASELEAFQQAGGASCS